MPATAHTESFPQPLTALTEDERLFQSTVRKFARDEIRPHVREMDEAGVFRKEIIRQFFELGLMGIDKEELAKAEQEYRQAISGTDKPDPSDYYRLGEACRLEGKIDDAIAAFTKASEVGQGPVKQFADQQIDTLKKAKAQSGTPAKP